MSKSTANGPESSGNKQKAARLGPAPFFMGPNFPLVNGFGAPPMRLPPIPFVMPGPPPNVFQFGVPPPVPLNQTPIMTMPFNQHATPFVPTSRQDPKKEEKNRLFQNEIRQRLGFPVHELKNTTPTYPNPSSSRAINQELNIEDSHRYAFSDFDDPAKMKEDIKKDWMHLIAAEALKKNMDKVKLLSEVCDEVVDFVTEYAEKLRNSIYKDYGRKFEEEMAAYSLNTPGSIAEDPFNSHTASLDVPINNHPTRNHGNNLDTQSNSSEDRVRSPVFDPPVIPQIYNDQPANEPSNRLNVNVQEPPRQRNREQEIRQDDESINVALDQINKMMHNFQSRPDSLSPGRSTSGSINEEQVQQFGRDSPGFRSNLTSQSQRGSSSQSAENYGLSSRNVQSPVESDYKSGSDYKSPDGSEYKSGSDYKSPVESDYKSGSDYKSPIGSEYKSSVGQSMAFGTSPNNHAQTPTDPRRGFSEHRSEPSRLQENQPELEEFDEKLAESYFKTFDFCMKTGW